MYPPWVKSFSGWADGSSLRVLIYSLAAFDGLLYCVCCLPPTQAGLVKTSFLRVSLQSSHSAREGRRKCTSVQCPYRTFCREAAQMSMNFMAKAYSSNTARPRPPSRSESLDCSVATVPELGAEQSPGYPARLPGWKLQVQVSSCALLTSASRWPGPEATHPQMLSKQQDTQMTQGSVPGLEKTGLRNCWKEFLISIFTFLIFFNEL